MSKRERPVPADSYTAVDLQVMRLLALPAKMEAEQFIAERVDRHRRQVRFERDIVEALATPPAAPVEASEPRDAPCAPFPRATRLAAVFGGVAAVVAVSLLWSL